MPVLKRPNPTVNPSEVAGGTTAQFGKRSPNLVMTPSPVAHKQVVLAGNTKISRRSFSPVNRVSKSICASISPIAKCSPIVHKTYDVSKARLRKLLTVGPAAVAKSTLATPSAKRPQTDFLLDIQSPGGHILLHDEMRIAMPSPKPSKASIFGGDNAHLDDNISVVTILDAIGFGQYAEVFENREIGVDRLLSMSRRDLEMMPEIGQENAVLLSRALQIL